MSRNVVNDYIKISKKSNKSYLKLIMGTKYNNMIFEKLFSEYINVRYYDMYENVSKSEEKNINYYLKKTSIKLIEENPKNYQVVKLTFGLFKYILYFDNVKEVDSWEILINKLKNSLNSELKYEFPSEQLIAMITETEKHKQEYLNIFKTNNFNLTKTKTNIKSLYDISVDYDIKFPRLYSEYAIEKVSNEEVIKEDRQLVEYYLVSIDLLKDIIDNKFNNNYLVSFNINLQEKKNKWTRLLNVIDSEVIKEHLIFKITYTTFTENKNSINKLINEGFHFALIIDETYTNNLVEDQNLAIFTYIIVHEKKEIYKNIKNIVIM